MLLGAWLTGRRDRRNWLRDSTLRSAAEFISAAGSIYAHRRVTGRPEPSAEVRAGWDDQIQRSRAAIHLLCDQSTIDAMEALSVIVWARSDDSDQDERSIEALRAFTRAVRRELMARERRR